MKKVFVIINLLLGVTAFAQQGSVGIGTQTPNQNAVLHLVAPNSDQGLLVPKLTTSQRNTFSNQLSISENGMMVYDSDLNQFFFWLSDHWEAVGSSLQAGAGLSISNGVIENTGDTDASDDFSGDWADLLNVPGAFSDGVDDVDDADNDPANELQDLSLTGDVLTITGLGNPTQVDLSAYLGVNTDEQDLQFASDQISLTGDPDNTVIDLTPYLDNTDLLAGILASEGNILSYQSGNWVAAADQVDDADSDPTNEIELPSTAGTGEVLKYDGAAWAAGSDEVDDADNDPTNELELPVTAGTGEVLIFDGTNWVAGADQTADGDTDATNELELPATAGIGQVLKFNDANNWVAAADEVNDLDADPANELQDLNLTSNILTITGLGSPTQINLASYSGTNTDEQDLQFSGDQITLTGDPDNTTIDLTPYLDNTDLLAGILVSEGQIAKYQSGVWIAADDAVNDSDSDPNNEIQDLQISTDLLSITNNASASTIDLSVYRDNTDVLAGILVSEGQIAKFQSGVWVAADDAVNDLDSNPSNEIQDLQISTDLLSITNNVSASTIDLSVYRDNTDVLAGILVSEGQIAKYQSGVWVAADDAVNDLDSNPSNEIQDLQISTDLLSITNNASASTIDLSVYRDNTDLLASVPVSPGDEGAVLKYAPIDGGWQVGPDFVDDADADPSNEFQELQYASNILSLTNDASSTSINFSGWDMDASDDITTEADPTVLASVKDGVSWAEVTGKPAGFADGVDNTGSTPWSEGSDVIGNFVEYGGHAKALNTIHLSVTLTPTDIGSSVLRRDIYKSAKNVYINAADIFTLTAIEDGINGQEIVFVNIGSGRLDFDNSAGGSNLFLPGAVPLQINRGGTLTLMYIQDDTTGFKAWVPMAGVGSPAAPK